MYKKFTFLIVMFLSNFLYMYGGVFHVRVDGDNSNDGRSWENAFASVQKAINSANYGDTVKIEEGEYFPEVASDPSNPRTKSFRLRNGIVVIGGYFKDYYGKYRTQHFGNTHPTLFSGDIGIKGDTTDNAYHVIYNPLENALDNNTLIKGITISHGNADGEGIHSKGGGIYLEQKSNLKIVVCFIQNNFAKSGAGIYNYGNQKLYVGNVYFENNRAINGGGIFNSFYSKPDFIQAKFIENKAKNGAAIYNSTGYIDIFECSFDRNLSGFGSTVYNYNCEVTLYNSVFRDNKSISNGGAVYSFGSVTKYDAVVFHDNESGQSGGAVSDFKETKSIFTNCNFNTNTASKHGGAYRSELNSFAEFIDCKFILNESSGYGGAIHINDNSEAMILNSEFDENSAVYLGGGVSVDEFSRCNIEESVFKNNGNPRFGGAIAIDTTGTLNIKNSALFGNSAIFSGGGIYGIFADINVQNVEFYENTTSRWEGGGLSATYGNTKIDGCNAYNNKSPLGAAIAFERVDARLTNTNIYSNIGNALLISQCSPYIENCSFTDNTNNTRGGGVYTLQADAVFRNCVFTGNKSVEKGQGGAIYNYDSEPTFENCDFRGNEANYGGVMFNYKAIIHFVQCVMEENKAYESGGAISNWGDTCFVSIKKSILSKNTAKTGAAFFCSGESSVTNVINSLITYNDAEYFGGAFHNRMKARVNIINSTFSGNRAGKYGGAIYGIKAYTSMLNSILWDNFAETQANSIYSIDGLSAVYNSCLPDNESDFVGDTRFYNCVYADPQFRQKGEHPFAIYLSSPCIDAGNDSFIDDSTDIIGLNRKIKTISTSTNTVDIGAYEFDMCHYPGRLSITTPNLVSPVNTAKYIPINAKFVWNSVKYISEYEIQLSHSYEFENVILSERTPDTTIVINNLQKTKEYYWRVRAYNSTDTSNWSLTRKFNTVGEIIYVNKEAKGNNTGVNWENAYTSFQTAIDSSGYGDSIFVAEGIYYPEKIIRLDGELDGERKKAFHMKNGVVMYGGFPSEGNPGLYERNPINHITRLSGDIGEINNMNDNCFHVIYNHPELTLDSTAVIDGFVISDGYTAFIVDAPDSFGAGMNNGDSNPTVINCSFINNHAMGGGGMLNAGHEEYYRGGPKIINCNFQNNSATKGGGAMRNYMSNVKVYNSIFSDNSNGIYNIMSDIYVDKSSFIDNNTAIMSTYSESEVYNSEFYGNNYGVYTEYFSEVIIQNSNFAGNNYAVYNSETNADIINCNFAANKSAIQNEDSNADMVNITVTDNETGVMSYMLGNIKIHNSIIWNNERNFSFPQGNKEIKNSCIPEDDYHSSIILENIIYDDPQLFESEKSYRLLASGSPCIDAGDNKFIPEGISKDLAGNNRITNSIIDMGAFEWNFNQDETSVSIKKNIDAKIYPNPADDYIEISINNHSVNKVLQPLVHGGEIAIYNVLGEKVLTESTHPMTPIHRMNVSNLPACFYFLRLKGLDKVYYKKLVIRR
jgi:predicted outer membrane repeat protein